MKTTVLLSYKENTKQVEDEEKSRFLRDILEHSFTGSGVDLEEYWPAGQTLSIEQRIKLRGLFTAYNFQVIDDLDGHMLVYLEGEKVAEWFKCTYKLKRDPQELDPRKQLYLEMEVNCWSLFEESEQEEK